MGVVALLSLCVFWGLFFSQGGAEVGGLLRCLRRAERCGVKSGLAHEVWNCQAWREGRELVLCRGV